MAGPTSPIVGCRFSTGEDLPLLVGPTSAPAGAVIVTPGVNSDLGVITDNSPAGTTFYLLAGHHVMGGANPGQFGSIQPKDGNTYIGAPGAVIDGRCINSYAFTGQAVNVRLAYIEVINFRSPIDQMVVNHDGGDNWTIEYCQIHHNKGAGVGVSGGSTLQFCWLHHNSQYAFSAVGEVVNEGNSTANLNITVHHCEIAYNGDQTDELIADGSNNPQGGGRNGAFKFWDSGNMAVYSNWIHNSHAGGVWADTNNVSMRLEGNIIEDNWGEGLFYEISFNFLIKDNMFARNGYHKGLGYNVRDDDFPICAVYVSESGGEPRLTSFNYGLSEITGNTFINNMNDIALWENPNRFCNSQGNTSNKIWHPLGGTASLAACNAPFTHNITVNLTAGSPVFTVVSGTFHWEDEGQFISGTGIPAGTQIEPPLFENDHTGGYNQYGTGLTGKMTANATQTGQFVMTFAAGTIDRAPYHFDCRWRTQNIHIHGNLFQHNQSEVLGPRNTLGPHMRTAKHCLISQGAYPGVVWYGNPYVGDEIQQAITYQQNNVWSSNTYQGSAYNWMPFDLNGNINFATWQAAPYNQDAGSTHSATDPVSGVTNTTVHLPDPPATVTAEAGNGQAKITFAPSPDSGGDTIVGYTVTSSPGGVSTSSRGAPIILSGLTNGTPYTFTVRTNSSIGRGAASAPSNSVTPSSGASFSTALPPWECVELSAYQRPDNSVEVSFFEPLSAGTSAITAYTATASPGGATATAALPPVTFTGLTAGTYTFTVQAASPAGTGPATVRASAPIAVRGAGQEAYFARVGGVTEAVTGVFAKESDGALVPVVGRTA
jgi:hypothetical protein